MTTPMTFCGCCGESCGQRRSLRGKKSCQGGEDTKRSIKMGQKGLWAGDMKLVLGLLPRGDAQPVFVEYRMLAWVEENHRGLLFASTTQGTGEFLFFSSRPWDSDLSLPLLFSLEGHGHSVKKKPWPVKKKPTTLGQVQ